MTYPTRFAGPRRDCSTTATTTAEGTVAWSRPLGFSGTRGRTDVLLWDDAPLVGNGHEVARFTSSGEPSWRLSTRPGSPVAIAGDRLYHVNPSLMLDVVDATGTVVEEDLPVPDLGSEEMGIALFSPGEKDFVTVTVHEEPTFDSEDGEEPPSLVMYGRTTYGGVVSDWGAEVEAVTRHTPVLVPETNALHMILGGIATAEPGGSVELARTDLPVDELSDWSADASGRLCLLGYRDGRATAVLLSPEREPEWTWTDADGADRWVARQPPVRCADGRIYALAEGRVLALEDGQVVWDFDVRSDALKHGASEEDGSFVIEDGRLMATVAIQSGVALGDGSLLFTTQNTLFHLDVHGHARLRVTFEDELISPPVVDGAGRLYVATAEALHQVR